MREDNADTEKRVRQSSCTTQKPPGVVTHATPTPQGSGQPQSRHHSPTARSSQRHVPAAFHSKSIAKKTKNKGKRGGGSPGERSADRD